MTRFCIADRFLKEKEAGAIHTDLARGFIRAETVAYQDLLHLGSMAEARKAGRLRSEGRTYRVQDGDVIEILFSR